MAPRLPPPAPDARGTSSPSSAGPSRLLTPIDALPLPLAAAPPSLPAAIAATPAHPILPGAIVDVGDSSRSSHSRF